MTWLSGWGNRIELTFDGSKIEEDLIYFPVMIALTSTAGQTNTDVTDVFNTLSGSDLKIAIADQDANQSYVEIENWDAYNKKATLWSNVTLSSGINTKYYLYYDVTHVDNTNYVGETGSVPATQVWDTDFIRVYHTTASGSTLYDSTSNAANATLYGTTSGIEGPLGDNALYLNNGYFNLTSSGFNQHNGTVESFVQLASQPYAMWLFSEQGTGNNNNEIELYVETNDDLHFVMWNGTSVQDISSFPKLDADGSWHMASASYNSSVGGQKLYIDGALSASRASFTAPATIGSLIYVGAHAAGTTNCAHMYINEYRLSVIDRSSAWLKATYYSNTDDLVSFNTDRYFFMSGYVKEKGIPVVRTVRAYRRDTGELVDSTISDPSTGYYYLVTTYSGGHSIVCLDDDYGLSYNDLIIGGVVASIITGD
jgi:hypothetical protein